MRVWRIFSDKAHLYATTVAALCRRPLVRADDVTDDVTASVPEVGATEHVVVVVVCGKGRSDGGGMAVVPRWLKWTSVGRWWIQSIGDVSKYLLLLLLRQVAAELCSRVLEPNLKTRHCVIKCTGYLSPLSSVPCLRHYTDFASIKSTRSTQPSIPPG